MNNFYLEKSYIIITVFIWLIINIRKPPCTFVSGLFSYLNSYLFLQFFHDYFGIEKNENFSIKTLLPSFENHKNQETSILDNLDLVQNDQLSEAEQNRRMRALRAIEERLESIQNK